MSAGTATAISSGTAGRRPELFASKLEDSTRAQLLDRWLRFGALVRRSQFPD